MDLPQARRTGKPTSDQRVGDQHVGDQHVGDPRVGDQSGGDQSGGDPRVGDQSTADELDAHQPLTTPEPEPPTDEGPQSPNRRHGVGLCLSGGGYRAALFHLGALRRLNELGVLGQVRTISAVSGGAITGQLLADPRLVWPTPPADATGTAAPTAPTERAVAVAPTERAAAVVSTGPTAAAPATEPTGAPGPTASTAATDVTSRAAPESAVVQGFDEFVAAPLTAIAARNVRTPALLSRLLPWRWTMADSGVRALADQFVDAIPWWSRPLRDNRAHGPGVVVGATEVDYGVDWRFADPTARRPHGQIGDYRLGHAEPPPGLRLADAVAASCAFPPFFAPMTFNGNALHLTGGHPGNETPQQRAAIRADVRLTDGGVYDNLALEPVWKDHAAVLVSDGGAVFQAHTEHTIWGRLLQILSIQTAGGVSVRLRWLHASYARRVLQGATWTLNTLVPMGYPRPTLALIDAVRTDLDAFSTQERHVLERHGYLVADQVVRKHAAELVRIDAPLRPPHDDVADPAVANAALKNSGTRTLFGRW